MALFFAVISLAGLGLTTANYWALTHALMPKKSIGRVIGIQNCANSLSGVAAPLSHRLAQGPTGSYEAPMIAILVFLLIGAVAYTTLAPGTLRTYCRKASVMFSDAFLRTPTS